MATSIFALVTLPPELVVKISSSLSRHDQFRLRSVCRQLALIVTPQLFRDIRLHGCGYGPTCFMNIAETEHLRGLVREINLETSSGSSQCQFPRTFTPNELNRQFPSEFFDALLFLRCFPNLTTLHVGIGNDEHNSYITHTQKPPMIFREVIEIAFHVLAGTWTDERQQQLQIKWKEGGFVAKRAPSIPLSVPMDPIPITTLTIFNIMEYTEPLFTDLDPFKSIFESRSLVDFRLYIATQTYGKQREYGALDPIQIPEQYAMFSGLPSAWLSLSLAANLQVLSIYCHERWGWLPRLDSEMTGPNGDMPNLKVLSLGRFTFSHQSQIDWFGSLELKELYLHDCAVLHKKATPKNTRVRKIAAARRARGRDIFSDDGWSRIPENDFPGDIRWNTIFDQWRESMTNLRVFKAVQEEKTRQDRRDPFLWYQSAQRANVFRYFSSALPNTFDSEKSSDKETFLKRHLRDIERDFGNQLSNESPLAYVCYEDSAFSIKLDVYNRSRNANLENVDKKSLEKGLISKDEAALELFESMVHGRQ
ncbi:hypothetical protein B0J13DRAFT_35274 [Dactylonectria estremocensis]|uniref:F-box domain-containing protein n=1 Tax=Dactylonectria estremocensis TaxID=1079267 RepID=A0A9P9FKX6_9HYPO|nr:hypothetical protein B0J13DRAFT_35274 [Dactylonectria estremocensis]